jgi:outer membrane receptor for ferrienterochelin and colicins
MKYLLSLCMVVAVSSCIYAQHTLKLAIKDTEDQTALQGVTAILKSLNQTAISDSSGQVQFNNVPEGLHIISISIVGMEGQ